MEAKTLEINTSEITPQTANLQEKKPSDSALILPDSNSKSLEYLESILLRINIILSESSDSIQTCIRILELLRELWDEHLKDWEYGLSVQNSIPIKKISIKLVPALVILQDTLKGLNSNDNQLNCQLANLLKEKVDLMKMLESANNTILKIVKDSESPQKKSNRFQENPLFFLIVFSNDTEFSLINKKIEKYVGEKAWKDYDQKLISSSSRGTYTKFIIGLNSRNALRDTLNSIRTHSLNTLDDILCDDPLVDEKLGNLNSVNPLIVLANRKQNKIIN